MNEEAFVRIIAAKLTDSWPSFYPKPLDQHMFPSLNWIAYDTEGQIARFEYICDTCNTRLGSHYIDGYMYEQGRFTNLPLKEGVIYCPLEGILNTLKEWPQS